MPSVRFHDIVQKKNFWDPRTHAHTNNRETDLMLCHRLAERKEDEMLLLVGVGAGCENSTSVNTESESVQFSPLDRCLNVLALYWHLIAVASSIV